MILQRPWENLHIYLKKVFIGYLLTLKITKRFTSGESPDFHDLPDKFFSPCIRLGCVS